MDDIVILDFCSGTVKIKKNVDPAYVDEKYEGDYEVYIVEELGIQSSCFQYMVVLHNSAFEIEEIE